MARLTDHFSDLATHRPVAGQCILTGKSRSAAVAVACPPTVLSPASVRTKGFLYLVVGGSDEEIVDRVADETLGAYYGDRDTDNVAVLVSVLERALSRLKARAALSGRRGEDSLVSLMAAVVGQNYLLTARHGNVRGVRVRGAGIEVVSCSTNQPSALARPLASSTDTRLINSRLEVVWIDLRPGDRMALIHPAGGELVSAAESANVIQRLGPRRAAEAIADVYRDRGCKGPVATVIVTVPPPADAPRIAPARVEAVSWPGKSQEVATGVEDRGAEASETASAMKSQSSVGLDGGSRGTDPVAWRSESTGFDAASPAAERGVSAGSRTSDTESLGRAGAAGSSHAPGERQSRGGHGSHGYPRHHLAPPHGGAEARSAAAPGSSARAPGAGARGSGGAAKPPETLSERSGIVDQRSLTAGEPSGTTGERSGGAVPRSAASGERSAGAADRSATVSEQVGGTAERSATGSERFGSAVERPGGVTEAFGASARRPGVLPDISRVVPEVFGGETPRSGGGVDRKGGSDPEPRQDAKALTEARHLEPSSRAASDEVSIADAIRSLLPSALRGGRNAKPAVPQDDPSTSLLDALAEGLANISVGSNPKMPASRPPRALRSGRNDLLPLGEPSDDGLESRGNGGDEPASPAAKVAGRPGKVADVPGKSIATLGRVVSGPGNSTGEPGKVAGTRGKLAGPPDKVAGPPDKVAGPPGKVAGPPGRSTGSPGKATSATGKTSGESANAASRSGKAFDARSAAPGVAGDVKSGTSAGPGAGRAALPQGTRAAVDATTTSSTAPAAAQERGKDADGAHAAPDARASGAPEDQGASQKPGAHLPPSTDARSQSGPSARGAADDDLRATLANTGSGGHGTGQMLGQSPGARGSAFDAYVEPAPFTRRTSPRKATATGYAARIRKAQAARKVGFPKPSDDLVLLTGVAAAMVLLVAAGIFAVRMGVVDSALAKAASAKDISMRQIGRPSLPASVAGLLGLDTDGSRGAAGVTETPTAAVAIQPTTPVLAPAFEMAPTETAPPPPTYTPYPTYTPPPTYTSPAPRQPTAAVAPPTTGPVGSSVALAEPVGGVTVNGCATFRWTAIGPVGPADRYELLVCGGDGCMPRNGISRDASPVTWDPSDTRGNPDLSGNEGIYRWAVVLHGVGGSQTRSALGTFRWAGGACGPEPEGPKPDPTEKPHPPMNP